MTCAIGALDARRHQAAALGEAAPFGSEPRAVPRGRRLGTAPALLSDCDAAAVRAGYRELFPLQPSLEPHLHGVLAEALGSPGSLVRAQLAFGMATGGGVARGHALRLAVAVEYFHTASLLFDDLPSMDDAAERRGRACAHRVWGEAAAILGALALIARAYELLWQVLSILPRSRRERAAALVAACVGAPGMLDGQARDLHFGASERSAQRVLEVAEGKTVSMIRLTVLLPALVDRSGDASLQRLDRLARTWGLAYQVLDDFQDLLLSSAESGKSSARDAALARPNLALVEGFAAAGARLDELLRESAGTLRGAGTLRRRYPQLGAIQRFLETEALALGSRLSRRSVRVVG